MNPRPWDRLLWGVVFKSSMKGDPPLLIGQAWHSVARIKHYEGEPTRTLVFNTRSEARKWVKSRASGWAGDRFRVVHVRETVTVKCRVKGIDCGNVT